MRPVCVLFDLDGTLADTAPDLRHALNAVLEENARPPLPMETVRPAASHGAIAMLRLGFPEANTDSMNILRDRFIVHYRANLARDTRLFEGIEQLLEALERYDLPWGIVTNKPASLTLPLLEALHLAGRAACMISGDTTPHPKPHPAPLLHACEILGCKPAEAIYVGDSVRDLESARRAGMPIVIAAWGYLDAAGSPAEWNADHVIHHPMELLDWQHVRSVCH